MDRTTIHIQGHGQRDALYARELRPGMRPIFNQTYHTHYVITAVIPAGAHTITIEFLDESTGKTYTQRRRAATLVAVRSVDYRSARG